MMKHESSPSAAVGPAASMSVVDQLAERSGEQDFSDDEPDNEIEALQHLPPEERRKALRRLRNRESARRVRARRLAEMSQMETTVNGMQEENVALKAHVGKLQQHVQQMTLKVYEVTAKYESAVAENAQLRAELQHLRRQASVPGESGFTGAVAPPAGLGAGGCASGSTPAAPMGVSPFVAPMETQSAPLPQLVSHAALRASSPMDLSHQRQALEEVVQLLRGHKHRGTGTDRSGCSDMASNAPTANPAQPAAAHPTSNSPGCDSVPVYGAGGSLAATLFTRGSASETSLLSHMAQQHQQQQQQQQQQQRQSALGLSQSLNQAQMAALNAQQQQQGGQGPQTGLSGPMASLGMGVLPSSGSAMPSLNPSGVLQGQSPQHSFHAQHQQQASMLQQQQQQELMRQHAALQQQMQYQMQAQAHQQAQAQQSMLQGDGSSQGSGYLPAQQAGAYFSAQAMASQLNAGACQPQPHSQPQAQPGVGLCGPSSAQLQPLTLGPSLGFSSHAAAANHRSASFAVDIRARGFCAGTVPGGVGSLAPSWHTAGFNAAGAAGVAMLRPEDITEDLFMSLEAYEPVQDL